jgi:hypothetical protein
MHKEFAMKILAKETSALKLSGLALLASAAFAVQAAPAGASMSAYEQEVARCNSGQSQQDRATCLKEARNAHAEALRGRLDDHQQPRYDANAVARCDRLPPADKPDCIDRMHGKGSVSGSVEGGGIYRETVTVVPAGPQDNGSSASGTSAAPGSASEGTLSTPPMEPTR